jgi:hypothetical protein
VVADGHGEDAAGAGGGAVAAGGGGAAAVVAAGFDATGFAALVFLRTGGFFFGFGGGGAGVSSALTGFGRNLVEPSTSTDSTCSLAG